MLVVDPAVDSHTPAMYQRTSASGLAQCDDADDILLYGGCDASGPQLEKTYPVNSTNNTVISGWLCDASGICHGVRCLSDSIESNL